MSLGGVISNCPTAAMSLEFLPLIIQSQVLPGKFMYHRVVSCHTILMSLDVTCSDACICYSWNRIIWKDVWKYRHNGCHMGGGWGQWLSALVNGHYLGHTFSSHKKHKKRSDCEWVKRNLKWYSKEKMSAWVVVKSGKGEGKGRHKADH